MDKKPILRKNTLSIEKVIEHLGGFGLFQGLIIASLMLMSPPRVFQVLFMVFGAQSPPWKCVTNSTNCTLNGTFSANNRRRCDMPRTEWEYTVPRDFSISTEFDLLCDREWMRHLLNSIIFVGWAVGAVTLGYVADNYGRRSVIYPSQVMIVIIGFITSFLNSVPLVIFCRFLIGIFIPAGTVQSFVLISEYVTSKYRPPASILLFLSFSSSTALFALKSYYVQRWRLLSIVSTAPYIITALSYFFVPESIRWIRLKGKQEHLKKTLRRIAYWNRKVLPPDLTIELPSDNTTDHAYSIIDVFRTRRLAAMGVCLGYVWLANGMVYYSLVFASSDLGGSIHRNFALLALIGIPANGFAMYLPHRFGRKKTVIISMIMSAIFCVSIPFVPRVIRLVCACLGRLFIGISFSSIYLWSVELYPTSVRANAMGFLQVTSRIGAASAPWIANGLLVVHVAAPYIAMSVAAFIGTLLLLYVPETKGRVMLETSHDVDYANTTNLLVDGDNHD